MTPETPPHPPHLLSALTGLVQDPAAWLDEHGTEGLARELAAIPEVRS